MTESRTVTLRFDEKIARVMFANNEKLLNDRI